MTEHLTGRLYERLPQLFRSIRTLLHQYTDGVHILYYYYCVQPRLNPAVAGFANPLDQVQPALSPNSRPLRARRSAGEKKRSGKSRKRAERKESQKERKKKNQQSHQPPPINHLPCADSTPCIAPPAASPLTVRRVALVHAGRDSCRPLLRRAQNHTCCCPVSVGGSAGIGGVKKFWPEQHHHRQQ